MNISDYVKPAAILDDAFTHPTMRHKAGRKPDIDMAAKSVVNSVEALFIEAVCEKLEPKLDDILSLMVITDGEHKDAKDKDAWESACDDHVENAIEAFVPYLSADWLGRNLINTDLHKAGRIKQFATKVGIEAYKNIARDKTPAKIMSSAGVTAEMIQKRLTQHNQQAQEGISMSEDAELQAVYHKAAKHIGVNHDIMAVYDDCDLASDDDLILANGAGGRLGLNEKDVRTLQIVRITHGGDAKEIIYAGIKAALESPSAAPEKKERKPRTTKAATLKATTPDAKPAKGAEKKPADVVPSEVLEALSNAGLPAAELATLMGVSRGTANNYLTGKAQCKPTQAQADALRAQVIERLNALHAALAHLDGSEAEVYY